MSHVMRKPDFCLCKNKDADQLHSNCEADQCLFFATWIVQSLLYLYPEIRDSSHLLRQQVLNLVGKPKDRFSRVAAHLVEYIFNTAETHSFTLEMNCLMYIGADK